MQDWDPPSGSARTHLHRCNQGDGVFEVKLQTPRSPRSPTLWWSGLDFHDVLYGPSSGRFANPSESILHLNGFTVGPPSSPPTLFHQVTILGLLLFLNFFHYVFRVALSGPARLFQFDQLIPVSPPSLEASPWMNEGDGMLAGVYLVWMQYLYWVFDHLVYSSLLTSLSIYNKAVGLFLVNKWRLFFGPSLRESSLSINHNSPVCHTRLSAVPVFV